MTWAPHATVATIVEQDGKLLLVEELSHNKQVFNQPAGHIEEGETIFEAAIRETLEETGWQVELKSSLGIYTYQAPQNGVTYYRFCFAAEAIERLTTKLDKDIIAAHWMARAEVAALGERLRSPLVSRCVEDYYTKPHLSLDTIYEHSGNQ